MSKFLFVSTYDLRRNTSGNIRTVALMNSLHDAGHVVHCVFVPTNNVSDKSIYDNLIKIDKLITFPRTEVVCVPPSKETSKDDTSISGALRGWLINTYSKLSVYDVFRLPLFKLKMGDLSELDDTYDYIVSSSEPRSSHLFAEKVIRMKEYQAKWILYWGDPMSNDVASDKLFGNREAKEEHRLISVFPILNEKCLFLLKKLLIEDNKVFDFMVDFEHKQYDTGKISFKFFDEMDKRFEFYRAESYGNDPFGDELDMKARNKNLQIGQFTLLMKYYKDSKNTRKRQIDNILKDFNQTYEVLSAQFTKRPLDRYALGTLKNYMYNCRFSFLMQDASYSFEELQKGLDEIMDIQSQTGILNFYPYRKAFEKALQMLRSNETLEKVELDEYKAFLQLCISKFSEAIQWCRTNCFYSVQNAYRECLVPVTNFGAVFIASSFCRPVRYGKLKDELNTFKSQALLMDNEIALRQEKKELKDLKKDIDHSRTREIEVLSVFTAIITFLFGTIGFFADNKNDDFLHLVFSILGLGAILLIFVSGIHMLTMRKEEKIVDYFKHPRAWFCIVTTLASIGLLIWLIIIVKSLPKL